MAFLLVVVGEKYLPLPFIWLYFYHSFRVYLISIIHEFFLLVYVIFHVVTVLRHYCGFQFCTHDPIFETRVRLWDQFPQFKSQRRPSFSGALERKDIPSVVKGTRLNRVFLIWTNLIRLFPILNTESRLAELHHPLRKSFWVFFQ